MGSIRHSERFPERQTHRAHAYREELADDDAAQFSREYKRLFGQPPMRDVERLRETARG